MTCDWCAECKYGNWDGSEEVLCLVCEITSNEPTQFERKAPLTNADPAEEGDRT